MMGTPRIQGATEWLGDMFLADDISKSARSVGAVQR
jgi:hypothetical protein